MAARSLTLHEQLLLDIMSGMEHSALYSVVTLFECMQDPATVAWLMQSDINLPGITPPGRYPTPAEIEQVIDAIPGMRAAYRRTAKVWQVTVRSRKDVSWACLAVRDYSGDEHEPHRFYFEGGWDEVILLITARLADLCGPMVLLHDSGTPP